MTLTIEQLDEVVLAPGWTVAMTWMTLEAEVDERGRVIPALADRWIVTDDGLSYIFRLRDGDWPDKTPITGETARTALLQAISALRGTPLGSDLAAIGEVRAMAGRVSEAFSIRATICA